ncbi:MAG: MFS transporter, partial [Chitinophagaceae bacterium]|nr:MFS transporter [Anaerolineae bacterium]
GAATLWVGGWILLFSFSEILPLSMASMFLASMGAPVVFTMALGLTQVMSPPEMRARLLSLFTMLSFGMQPVAALVVGTIAENFGVQTAMTFNALALIIGAVLILIARSEFRRWVLTINPTTLPTVEAAL